MKMTKKLRFAAAIALAFAATTAAAAQCSLFASTYTWKAGDGTFSDSSNWDPEGQPGSGDDVVLPKAAAAYTVTVSTAFKIGSLTVGGGAEAAAPTINFDNGLTTNEVTGSVYVYSGPLTHTAQPSSATTVQKALKLKVGENMTVASGAHDPFDRGRSYSRNSDKLIIRSLVDLNREVTQMS